MNTGPLKAEKTSLTPCPAGPAKETPTAELLARFERIGGATRLTDRFHRSPLKIAKAFPRENGSASLLVMDASPGMMAGDVYRQRYELGAGADVFVTNQSYTKVHPCAERPAVLQQELLIGPGARLDYRPEPLMLYENGAISAATEVRLREGGMLLLSEVLGPGRWLRGETFRYRFYDNKLQVRYGADDELIFYNRQRFAPLEGPSEAFRHPGAWNGHTHLAVLYVFSDRLGKAHKEEWQAWASEAYPSSGIGFGAAHKHGLMLSVMGSTAWELLRIVDEARSVALKWHES